MWSCREFMEKLIKTLSRKPQKTKTTTGAEIQERFRYWQRLGSYILFHELLAVLDGYRWQWKSRKSGHGSNIYRCTKTILYTNELHVCCVKTMKTQRERQCSREVQSALVKSSTRLELRQLIYISEYKFPFLSLYIIRQQLYRHSAKPNQA